MRRSVEKDVTEFVGWERMLELARALDPGENRALFAVTFLTGGRISEVLELDADNFIITEEYIRCKEMSLKKRYKKVEEWIEWINERPTNVLRRLYHWNDEKQAWFRRRYKTVLKEETRAEFAFPRTEPLASVLVQWVESRDGPLFLITRFKAWQILNKVGIYPHWLRAQRASCLIAFWGFTMDQMMEWMGWEELTTARHYGKMGWRKLADRFKGTRISPRILEAEQALLSREGTPPPPSPSSSPANPA